MIQIAPSVYRKQLGYEVSERLKIDEVLRLFLTMAIEQTVHRVESWITQIAPFIDRKQLGHEGSDRLKMDKVLRLFLTMAMGQTVLRVGNKIKDC